MTDQFILTENHLKLLSQLCIRFNDHQYYGAAGGDMKYPYGDSMVMDSVAKIIGIRPDNGQDLDEPLTDTEEATCLAIHEETATALQIVLQTKSFATGRYGLNEDNRWELFAD